MSSVSGSAIKIITAGRDGQRRAFTGEVPKRVLVRSSQYLNNLIEQDHRRIKQRLRPMLGLKSFETATIVISGIELAEKIKKGQFKIGKLGRRRAMPQEIWQAAFAA